MLDLLTRGKALPIALDMGRRSVKMLQLARRGQALRAVASARRALPDASGDPDAHRAATVAAIREMLREGGFRGRAVHTALPSNDLEIKNVRLAPMSAASLEATILEEASERLGFEVSADRLKYFSAGSVRDGAESRNELIVLATSRESVERHLETVESAGLRIECIDAEPTALFRSHVRTLRRSEDGELVWSLIEIGVDSTRVIVAQGQQILFIKRLDCGGGSLVAATAEQHGMSVPEAEELHRRVCETFPEPLIEQQPDVGDDEARKLYWAVFDGMRDQAMSLIREVSLCLRYCSVTFRGLRPGQVILSGGWAYDPVVRHLFQDQLGLPCRIAQPLRGVDFSAARSAEERRGPMAEWSLCAGLCLRGIEAPDLSSEGSDVPDRLSA